MLNIHETVYPRFKSNISTNELENLYTPSEDEIQLADKNTRNIITKFCFLLTIKTFQKLGYFISVNEIPQSIIKHIALKLNMEVSIRKLIKYDKSRMRKYHIALIRKYLSAKPYNADARHLLVQTIGKSALTKDEPLDLINLAIEELIKNCYELPAFTTLNKAAVRIRGSVNRAYYREIFNSLSREFIEKTDKIVESAEDLVCN